MDKDWFEWHKAYEDPSSSLSARLGFAEARLRTALDEAPPGEIRIVSLCAGQGRDVIGAVVGHPRQSDVRGRLVELDERNVDMARQLSQTEGLDNIEVVRGDASSSDAYAGAVPAHIVVACGIFGNITDADIRRTVGLISMLCHRGATVLWTRHRRPPDLTPEIRKWFVGAGYEEIGFDAPADRPWVSVGTNRWLGEDGVLERGVGFFEFVADRLAPS